jgi:hypothetical protein
MRKRIFALMAFVSLSLACVVGCKSDADDGVGEKPRPSTEDSFYFRNGAKHTIHMTEREDRVVFLDGVSDNFTFTDNAGTGLTIVQGTVSTTLNIRANTQGTYEIVIADTKDGAERKATLVVEVAPRDTGWRDGVYTIEDIDGDKTEANSNDYVDVEYPDGYQYDSSSLSSEASTRITVSSQAGNIVRVTAKNHYDSSAPLEFKLKHKTDASKTPLTVKVKRVTKFWNYSSNVLYGISNKDYVTQYSFTNAPRVPKVPYSVTYVNGGNPSGGDATKLYGNPIITRIDLNNVETVSPFAFANSANLETVIAPKVKLVYYGAFYNTKLAKIELPDLEELYTQHSSQLNGSYSSYDVRYNIFPATIRSIIIGKNVKKIGYYAFVGTENSLAELRIGVEAPTQIDKNTFKYTPEGHNHYGNPVPQGPIGKVNNAALYVPNRSLAEWKTVHPWITTVFTGGVRGY